MERRDGTMLRKVFSIFSLFIIPAVVLTTPLAVQSDPVDPEDVARMKSGHQKVEGVVTEIKSGLYTVKTSYRGHAHADRSGGRSSRP